MCSGVAGTGEQGRKGLQPMVHTVANRCKMSAVEAGVIMATLPSCKHSVRLQGEKWIFGLGGSRYSIQCNYVRLTADGGVRDNQDCRILKSNTMFYF